MAKIYSNRWETIRPLAEGGQAHTFLVRDIKGEGEIHYVLKRLKNINRLERFKREIEVVRNLSHENIVTLFDFDLEAKEPYLVSEFCSGGSLAAARPFWHASATKAFAIFQEVCEGVAYAHDHNVIHRDIKPDNIFLRTNDGPAVVGDFGICYVEDDGSRLTITEEAVGPRQFIAPELEDGRLDKISSKSDTYSLGKLLYWLFSGGEVFSREKHRELKWDLKGRNDDSALGWNNIYMEHVNRLLDLMIVNEPENRRSVRTILRVSRKITKLVEKEFSPISKDIKHPCKYCGYGIYELRAKKISNVFNFGLNPVGDPDWRIYTCDFCGHVQMFRVDFANKKEWWD